MSYILLSLSLENIISHKKFLTFLRSSAEVLSTEPGMSAQGSGNPRGPPHLHGANSGPLASLTPFAVSLV